MRTLLVEDSPKQRDMYRRWLGALELDVTALADGHSGFLAHLCKPFQLLVIDWVTPGLDGLGLCQRIRSMPSGDQPYILIITGRDRECDLAAVFKAGADDYIAKPFDAALLQTRSRIAIRRVRSDAKHREAREALARSEADFRRVIERSPLGVFAERDGRLVYANAAALRTIRAERDQVLDTPVLEFVTEGYRKVALRRRLRFERTRVPPPPMEMELRRGDGTKATVRVIPATEARYEGRRATFTILEDITAREEAQRELRMTQFAIDHAVDAAFWLRDDGRISYVNHAACSMSGYTRTELIGTDIAQLDSGTQLRSALLSGARLVKETALRRRDGRDIPIEVTANALSFQGERVVIAFARDLTERNRLQASLQKADRLASVGSLAAGVAHEINNPLAYVVANLELMAEDLARMSKERNDGTLSAVLQTLGHATQGAHRVRRIVGDLKRFAREDEAEPTAVDLHEVLDAAIDIAANEIRHRARLERDYGDITRVVANGGRLSQVFLNLLVNAAHAIPEDLSDDDVIRVRTWTEEPGWIAVEISDTGVGIEPDIIDHIFDPFFTTKPQGVGTGLGLSICHGIITAVGGSIEVDSVRGQGTSFRIRLPAAQTQPVVQAPVGTAAPVTGDRELSILVVDDEPMICEGIRRALSTHKVAIAPSGRDAIRMCQSGEFDLILCDVMMPDLSGMEVFGQIGATRPALAQRFVFMTGGAFTPKAQAFLASIENEHLTKPFSLRELRSLVAKRAAPGKGDAQPTSSMPG